MTYLLIYPSFRRNLGYEAPKSCTTGGESRTNPTGKTLSREDFFLSFWRPRHNEESLQMKTIVSSKGDRDNNQDTRTHKHQALSS